MQIIKKGKIKLKDLEAGKLFMFNDTIALKSEYLTANYAVEAFILGTGEMFWGGTSTAEKQRELEVVELEVEYNVNSDFHSERHQFQG